MTRAPATSVRLQRLAIRTGRGPLARAWGAAYEVVARAFAAWLVTGVRDASVYARGSLAARQPSPGLSDVDLVVVTPDDAGAATVERRHARLARARPWLADVLLEEPRVHTVAELAATTGTTILTAPDPAYGGRAGTVRALERPRVGGELAGWRRLRGPERRPPRPVPDAHARRLSTWLEVQYRWRWAWRMLGGDLPGPRATQVGARLLTELDALAAHPVPAAADAVAQAGHAVRSPTTGRLPPDVVLAAALTLTQAIAADIASELADVPHREVALERGPLLLPAQPAHHDDASLVPLADWRAVVRPWPPDEALAPHAGDPRDPAVLCAAQRASERPVYPALRTGSVLLLAPGAKWYRGALRSVQCAASDPVSFALVDGHAVARFPEIPGWSVGDWARRAVAEHASAPRSAGSRLDPATEALGLAIGAARAALLHESLAAGAPSLPLTASATLRTLGERTGLAAEAEGAYRAALGGGAPPPLALATELRAAAGALPAFAA